MYIIKSNLPPSFFIPPERKFRSKIAAITCFNLIVNKLTDSKVSLKSFIRNEKGRPLRATIQAEINSFFYYVEVFRS